MVLSTHADTRTASGSFYRVSYIVHSAQYHVYIFAYFLCSSLCVIISYKFLDKYAMHFKCDYNYTD